MLPTTALSLGLLTFPFLARTAPLEARAPCSNYVILEARGTNEPQGQSVGFRSMEAQTLAAVPGGTTYYVVYPAANDTESLGGADIVRYINAGLVACPEQKYAVLGYSQGATAVATALLSFPFGSAGYNAISAALVLGSPTKIARKMSNVDQFGGGLSNGTDGVYTSSYRVKVPEDWYQSGKFLDVCFTDDLVCNGLTPTAVLNLFVNHFLYGFTPSVQNLGAKFLISKLGGE
jgi:hypothetical protein